MQLLFLSGSKTLLWSEIQRFSPSNMQLFFSLIEDAALERHSAIFTLVHAAVVSLGSKLLWSEIQRFFTLVHAAVFLSGSKFGAKFSDFHLEHAAVFSLWIEEAVFGAVRLNFAH